MIGPEGANPPSNSRRLRGNGILMIRRLWSVKTRPSALRTLDTIEGFIEGIEGTSSDGQNKIGRVDGRETEVVLKYFYAAGWREREGIEDGVKIERKIGFRSNKSI